MTLEEAKTIISTVSYKPGWTLDILMDRSTPFPIIRIISAELDATGKLVGLCDIVYDLGLNLEDMTEQRLLMMVERTIAGKEDHEFREWFKVKGKNVYNPHPELSTFIATAIL